MDIKKLNYVCKKYLNETDKDLTQCVIKVKDSGNATEFIEVVEDDTDFLSQYDVDVEYQDEEDDPTVSYLLMYHKGKKYKNGDKLYNEFKEPFQFDESLNEFAEYTVTIGDEQSGSIDEPYEYDNQEDAEYQYNILKKEIKSPKYVTLNKHIEDGAYEELKNSSFDESLNESADYIDKLKEIENEVRAKINELYADDKDLLDYFHVESGVNKGHYDDGSDMYYIEVRGELNYDDMSDLADKLDPIVQKYDEYAYFDMETGGIIVAALNFDRKEPEYKVVIKDNEVTSNLKYDTYEEAIDICRDIITSPNKDKIISLTIQKLDGEEYKVITTVIDKDTNRGIENRLKESLDELEEIVILGSDNYIKDQLYRNGFKSPYFNIESYYGKNRKYDGVKVSGEEDDITSLTIWLDDNNYTYYPAYELDESLDEAETIYSPRLILQAYKKEQEWYKSENAGEDEQLPQIMLFIIENNEIIDTKLINRKDVYTYQPEENEYYLDRVRDSGDVLTDYNLEPAQKLVDRWNKSKQWESLKGYKEVAKIIKNDKGYNVAQKDEPMLVEDKSSLKSLLTELVKYL